MISPPGFGAAAFGAAFGAAARHDTDEHRAQQRQHRGDDDDSYDTARSTAFPLELSHRSACVRPPKASTSGYPSVAYPVRQILYGHGVKEGFLQVTPSCAIASDELEWRTTTSGGPGGQHANKSDTRVEVSFRIDDSESLGPRQRARLLERLGPVVRATASDTRSQSPEP